MISQAARRNASGEKWLWLIMVKCWPQRAWRKQLDRTGSWVNSRDDTLYANRGMGLDIVDLGFQSIKKMGKDSCPYLKNIDRWSYKDGSREPFPVFHNLHRKGRKGVLAWKNEFGSTVRLLDLPEFVASAGNEKPSVADSLHKEGDGFVLLTL